MPSATPGRPENTQKYSFPFCDYPDKLKVISEAFRTSRSHADIKNTAKGELPLAVFPVNRYLYGQIRIILQLPLQHLQQLRLLREQLQLLPEPLLP